MIGQVLAIARNTFLESVRQPIFYILILVGYLLQVFNLLLSMYSMGFTDSAEVTKDDKLLLDIGLATVFILSTLLAAFAATSVLAREIENKTVLTVVSKPVSRPIFIIGKYLGVTGAILVASIILMTFLLFAIRHQVMSTASDKVDTVVLAFSLLALLGSLGLGVWGNFFYGWVFPSTATLTLFPLTLLAYLGVLLVSKEWTLQPIGTDFKAQVMIACACVLLAMFVLCGVAIAASTRLGQVMTIGVCAGVFVFGLMSNHLIGRRAFSNQPVGQAMEVQALDDVDGDFSDPTDVWRLKLMGPPRTPFRLGDQIWYGPSPVGVRLAVPEQDDFEGDPTSDQEAASIEGPRALVVRATDRLEDEVTLVNVGGLEVDRPPLERDYIFLSSTEVGPVSLALWSVIPNLQFYWLVDAVTQAHRIPPRYLALAGGYTLLQVIGLLSLSVILFQKREVG